MKVENANAFINAVKEKGYNIRENVLLKEYTSLKLGGPASMLCEPQTIEEVSAIMKLVKQYDIPYYVIGNGSNVLVSDNGYQGLIIVTKTNLRKIRLEDNHVIVADAGISLKEVCLFAHEHALSGLEFAYGIPATVGGAVFMNAGAYGGEIKDVLLTGTYLDEDGEVKTLENESLSFSYRYSYFNDKEVFILEASFQLQQGIAAEVLQKMDELFEKRSSKQPLEYPSAGSTFKRPEGNYASALIEQSGMKGYRHGNAMVSAKHAGFILNYDNATSQEFLELIQKVKDTVKEKTGYQLECEVRIIGEEA